MASYYCRRAALGVPQDLALYFVDRGDVDDDDAVDDGDDHRDAGEKAGDTLTDGDLSPEHEHEEHAQAQPLLAALLTNSCCKGSARVWSRHLWGQKGFRHLTAGPWSQQGLGPCHSLVTAGP